MKKNKLLFVTSGLATGGAELQLYYLIRHLKKVRPNIEIFIYSLKPGGKFFDWFKQIGVFPSFCLKDQPSAFEVMHDLRKYIDKTNPNIIQTWMYKADLYVSLINLFSLKKLELYWGVRTSFMNVRGSIINSLSLKLLKVLSFMPKKIIYNSFCGAKEHENEGFNTKKTIVIQNGLDYEYLNKFKTSQAHANLNNICPDLANKKIILHVARVHPMKNHDLALKIAKYLPDYCFIFIGKGTNDLKRLKNTIFLGERSPYQFYHLADLMISTSSYGEGFSNVISEAIAFDLPVIATNIGDASLIIGKFGKTLPVDATAELFANEISKLKKSKISKNININGSRYSIESMTRSYLNAWNL